MLIEMKRPEDCEVAIDPDRFFHSGNNTAGRFRKIAELAAASDLLYGTNCVEQWLSSVETYIGLQEGAVRFQEQRRNELLAKGHRRLVKGAEDAKQREAAKLRRYKLYKEILEKASNVKS